jgi:hypothetical protein
MMIAILAATDMDEKPAYIIDDIAPEFKTPRKEPKMKPCECKSMPELKNMTILGTKRFWYQCKNKKCNMSGQATSKKKTAARKWDQLVDTVLELKKRNWSLKQG